MKNLQLLALLILVAPTMPAQEQTRSDEHVSAIIENLSSKNPEERRQLYWTLPQEIREKVVAVRQQQAREQEKENQESQKHRRDLTRQGSDKLEFLIGDYYRAAGEAAAGRLDDVRSREKCERRVEKNFRIMRHLIFQNDPVRNIAIWEKYKPTYETITERYPFVSVDTVALIQIEKELVDPLIRELSGDAKLN